ncbi:ABC transporter ATP-binding protein [Acetobacteraceae bacterium]|nr:ABC transporter ATP-binding protein [Candidatus Parcubacteria bacterium]
MNVFKQSTFALLLEAFRGYYKHLAVLTGLGILGAALEGIGIGAVIPLLSFLINGAEQSQDIASRSIAYLFNLLSIPFQFRYLLIFIVLLFVVRAAALVYARYIRGGITSRFLYSESRTVFERVLRASWPYLVKQQAGHLQSALTRNIQRTRDLLDSVTQIIQSTTGAVIYFAVAFSISPFITSATLVAGAIFLFAFRPLILRVRRLSNDYATTEKRFLQYAGEHIAGLKSIKASGKERPALLAAEQLLKYLQGLAVKLALARAVNTSFIQPFGLMFIVIMFAFTYNTPGFSLPTFAASLYLMQKIFMYLEATQVSFQTINELLPYAENSLAVKRELALHTEPHNGTKEATFQDSITFKNVSFSYMPGTNVLSDITIEIHRGEVVGLVGPSGSGKTTIADMLLALLQPTQGDITVDGVPLGEVDIAQWRKKISYVPQDFFLFNDSIEENIRLYQPELTHEKVEQAAKQANIHDFIIGLPEGYQTIVGDRGALLSGGQRQRIALARSLVSSPSLLILDEATSALDSESEQLIQKSLDALRGKLTVVVIAHRLTTIENADKVMVLSQGCVVENGSPKELMQNPDSYLSRGSGKTSTSSFS